MSVVMRLSAILSMIQLPSIKSMLSAGMILIAACSNAIAEVAHYNGECALKSVTVSGVIGGVQIDEEVPAQGGMFKHDFGNGYRVEGSVGPKHDLEYTVVGPRGPIYFGTKTGPLQLSLPVSYVQEVARNSKGNPSTLLSVRMTSGREATKVYPPDAPFPLPGTDFNGKTTGASLEIKLDDSPRKPFAHPSQFSNKDSYVAAYVSYALDCEQRFTTWELQSKGLNERRKIKNRTDSLARSYRSSASKYWDQYQRRVREYQLRRKASQSSSGK